MTDWEYVLEGAAMHGKLHEVNKRKWVGLTEDEIRAAYGQDLNYRDGDYVRYARAIEAKLKEKNT